MRLANDPRPPHDFRSDLSAELLGRVYYWFETQRGQVSTNVRQCHDSAQFAVPTIDDVLGSARRKQGTLHEYGLLITKSVFRHRRNIGKRLRTRATSYRQRAQLALPHVGRSAGQ